MGRTLKRSESRRAAYPGIDPSRGARNRIGDRFKNVFSELIGDIVERLWEMHNLDQEITALNHRPPDAANAAGVRPVDWITPAFRGISPNSRSRSGLKTL